MIKCPRCGSKGVRKASVVFDQGISRGRGASTGFWVSGRGPGVWFGRSANERMSRTAELNSPPVDMRPAIAGGLVGGLGLLIALPFIESIGGFFAAIIFVMLAAIGGAAAVYVLYKDEIEAAQESYEKLWYCSRCGCQFEVDLDAHSTSTRESAEQPRATYGHSADLSRRQEYARRVEDPVQRARSATARDLDGLRRIRDRCAADMSFDPCAPWPLDLGIVSRLSSLGYLTYDRARDVFQLTTAGRTMSD